MKKVFVFAFLAISLFLTQKALAVSVGTAPGVLDLGEVEPGKTVYFKFYLTTNAKNDMLVYLSYMPPHRVLWERNQTGRYTFLPLESSEEDISDWVEIVTNPVFLSPMNVRLVYLPTGGVVRANAEVTVKLRIPKDADPCYHAGSINLSPRLPAGGRGAGITTIGVTRFIFVFKVKGNAKREGKIIDILADREAWNKARIDVLFKNTGTCTLSPYISSLKLFDSYGNLSTTLSSGRTLVKPGEIVILSAYWTKSNLPSGKFTAEAKVSYLTGDDVLIKEVEIPAIITPKPKVVKCEFPTLIFLLVLAAFILTLFLRFRYWILVLTALGITMLAIALNYFLCLGLINEWTIVLIVIISAFLIYYWIR